MVPTGRQATSNAVSNKNRQLVYFGVFVTDSLYHLIQAGVERLNRAMTALKSAIGMT